MSRKPLNIVVTGGNNGIGFETAKELYLQGHNVFFGSRNQAKNKEAVELIKKAGGESLQKHNSILKDFSLDLSAKKSVSAFADEVKRTFKNVDILINNAGLASKQFSRNEDGIETTLAINHFGHFYLTYLLFDAIKVSPQGRIINVSSSLHYSAPDKVLEDIECKNKSYGTVEQYNISKFFNVLFTQQLYRKINKFKNLKTFTLHPGAVSTGFGSDLGYLKCIKSICCCIFVEQAQGARTSLYLATEDFDKLRNGEYYDDDTRHKEMDKRARDPKLAEDLWKMSEKVYGIKFEP